MKKIRLNPNNRNLRQLCAFYPCHAGIPDDEYDCRMCYCSLYQSCSKLELTDLGGYWLYYQDENGKSQRVWACEKCTVVHYRAIYTKIAHWRRLGLSDEQILHNLIAYVKGRV